MLNTKGENQQHVQAVLCQMKVNDNSGSKKHIESIIKVNNVNMSSSRLIFF